MKATSMNGVRLFDVASQQTIVVDPATRRAWADENGDGRIAASARLSGPRLERALRAAADVEDLFVAPVPGTTTPDGAFQVRGIAGASEIAALDEGQAIDAERNMLKVHLDFFDRDGNGKLAAGETFRGFRAVGFPAVGAGVKTTLVSLLFGKPREGFDVDVDSIGSRRRGGSTGVYDKDGRIDEARLGELEAEFDKKGGVLTQDEVTALLESRGAGTVSRGQFKSLFTVCQRINGNKTVTAAQLRGLFDGSLLWQAASLTDNEGKRGLGT